MKAEKWNKVVKTEPRYTLCGITPRELELILSGLEIVADNLDTSPTTQAIIEIIEGTIKEDIDG